LSPGFNVETVEYKNISFTVWDVGELTPVELRANHPAESAERTTTHAIQVAKTKSALCGGTTIKIRRFVL
jgi:hypothetical protein